MFVKLPTGKKSYKAILRKTLIQFFYRGQTLQKTFQLQIFLCVRKEVSFLLQSFINSLWFKILFAEQVGVWESFWVQNFSNLSRFKALFASKAYTKLKLCFKVWKSQEGNTSSLRGRRFSPPMTSPFLDKLTSACRHGEFIERTGTKTIANVRTIDECVKRMNGVFSLENTESEYKVLFAV